MKFNNYIFIFVVLLVYSCNDSSRGETDKMIQFLNTNYEFNLRVLNNNKAKYYNLVDDQPIRKNIKLERLDSIFKLLISEIDEALIKKEISKKVIFNKGNKFLSDLTETVRDRKDFQISNFQNIESKSDELQLNFIKNEIVIAMSYAFEYNSLLTSIRDGYSYAKIDKIVLDKFDNKYKLTLFSEFGQKNIKNGHVLINSIKRNKIYEKVSFNIKNNYSFADIEFDTLQPGTYKIEGIIKYYDREGEFEIPFQKPFVVE